MNKTKQESHNMNRRKLVATISMLLIAVLLLTGAGFAWIVMSVAPEATGLATQVGANGSLEIALLNKETHADLSKISSGAGRVGNYAWRNIVEIDAEESGLANITLYPARLNIEEDGNGGYRLKDSYLSVPKYDYSGQVVSLEGNTYGVTYDGEKDRFIGDIADLDFGVRGFGSSSSVTAQGAAIAYAKSNIATFTSNAKNTATTTLKDNAYDLLSLVIYKEDNNVTFDNADIQPLSRMITALEKSYTNIDSAIRQGLIAYAASAIADTDAFNTVKKQIEEAQSLSSLIGEFDGVPEAFATWVDKLDELKNKLTNAKTKYNELTDNDHTWNEVSGVMNALIDINKIYLGGKLFNGMSNSELTSLISSGYVEMTLPTGSGVFADIADFTGNYSTSTNVMGSNIEIKTLSTVGTPYLTALATGVSTLEADGGNSGKIELNNIYGYALDLAFRCNAPLSELLLQTDAISRIGQDDSGASTMGAGSFMEFSTASETFSLDQMTALMDAIRVAFIDDKGAVLGIAKLNVSNRLIIDDVITAPLYLYEFTIIPDEYAGGYILKMGERRSKGNNDITQLDQNVAKAVTALVWLDGDIVDNTMVAADSKTSLNGILNLQFASSANLISADNSDLKNLTPNKSDLEALIEQYRETYEAGQNTPEKMYTTASWNAFAQVYEYAKAVYDNPKSADRHVYKAQQMMINMSTLEETSIAVLQAKIDEYREILDTNNLVDAGDGVKVPKWTEDSWNAFVQAIHQAKALVNDEEHTEVADMDMAISALENAHKALIPYATKTAYDLDGELYYRIVSDDEDTYGLWYDANDNKVISDLTILKLDSLAKEAQTASISNVVSYLNKDEELTLYPNFDILYPEITSDKIIAIQWSVTDNIIGGDYTLAMTTSQSNLLNTLISEAETLGLTDEVAAANAFKETKPTAEEAKEAIETLKAAIDTKKAEDQSTTTEIELPRDFSYADLVSMHEVNQMQTLYYHGEEGSDSTGEVSITATILTENGFVSSVEFKVTIYASSTLVSDFPDNIEINGKASRPLSVRLSDQTGFAYGEHIDRCEWSSDNTERATVTANGSQCTVESVSNGYTTVRVSVYTKEGNVYTKSFTISVNGIESEESEESELP